MAKQETKRPAFQIAGIATVKHLNVRKEGPDDEKVLAVDIKLEIKGIDKRICGYFDDALEAFLWRGDRAMIVRNIFLSPIHYVNEIAGAFVNLDGEQHSNAEVKKFTIEPRDGGVVNLGCSVTVYPTSTDVSKLAKLVQDDARISIEGPRDLFDEPALPEVTESLKKLDKMAKEDNTTITIVTPEGNIYGPLVATKSADPLIPEALAACIEAGRASVTLLREKLGVGYTRAARIIDTLESAGKVGRMNATGVREVLATA